MTTFPETHRDLLKKVERKYGANIRAMDPPGQQRVVVTLRPVKVNAIDQSRG